jgi:hypothetical protein
MRAEAAVSDSWRHLTDVILSQQRPCGAKEHAQRKRDLGDSREESASMQRLSRLTDLTATSTAAADVKLTIKLLGLRP